jgi:hypothetical protein
MSDAEGVPTSAPPIDADLTQDLLRRLSDLEAIVKRLNAEPPPTLCEGSGERERGPLASVWPLCLRSWCFDGLRPNRIQGTFVDKSGHVGIGTTEPGSYALRVNGSLSVAGPVKVGTDSMPVATEPLRLVGGTVFHSGRPSPTGSLVEKREEKDPQGCSRTTIYKVTFVQPFTSTPAVSIVAISGDGIAALGDVGSRLSPPPFEALLPEETATLVSLDKKEMVVRTSAPKCGRTAPIFSFIAIGPA